MKLLSTKETAEVLGVSTVRIFQMIQEGILPAEKIGRDWFVKEADVETAKNRPKRGRPAEQKDK